tara:strand:- start:813 stop:1526 length:714 start_codon:yes stop_codon:yes gene_type:complete
MARISTYGNASPVVAADKWIGSDSQNNNQTKNFTAQAVADFINRIGGQAQNLRYTYNDTAAYKTGSLAFTGGGAGTVLLNTITTINAGAFDTRSGTTNVSTYLETALLNSEILLTQCDDIANWAIYTLNSATKKGGGLELNLGLTFKAGGGSLTPNKDYFISLLNYDSSATGDLNFTFSLPGNALSYLVTHNLNKFPSVSVFESGTSSEIYGEVVYNNLNQCTITFTSLVTGTATFN